jgi:tetratricopeptide (TPR) repeat protein
MPGLALLGFALFVATVIHNCVSKPGSSIQSHPRPTKVAVAFLLTLILFYCGISGRRRAVIEGRLDEIEQIRDLVEQRLEQDQNPAQTLLSRLQGLNADASRLPSQGPQMSGIILALRTPIQKLEADYGLATLTDSESIEIRLSRAVLANAERRFDEALTDVTVQDESNAHANTRADTARSIRALQVRGESFYALGHWPEALDRYGQVLAARPGRLSTLARLADCNFMLGRTNQSLSIYSDLAKQHLNRGDEFLARAQSAVALGYFQRAMELYTCLVEQAGRTNLNLELARSLGSVAWIYATCPDKSYRNGARATEYARRVCEMTGWKAPVALETLAAACAETGNFTEAVQWQQKALQLVPARSRLDAQSRLELYKTGKPYRPPGSKAD